MTPAPKRRWSFSLRTLFVVVTVGTIAAFLLFKIGLWFAWVWYRADMGID